MDIIFIMDDEWMMWTIKCLIESYFINNLINLKSNKTRAIGIEIGKKEYNYGEIAREVERMIGNEWWVITNCFSLSWRKEESG